MKTRCAPLFSHTRRRPIRLNEDDYNIEEYNEWAQINERPDHDALITQTDIDKHLGNYLEQKIFAKEIKPDRKSR